MKLQSHSHFGKQVGWVLLARLVAAFIQLVVLLLLARQLEPTMFAYVVSANTLLIAVASINGLGYERKIMIAQSQDPQDPILGEYFSVRLFFTYASSVVWVIGCVGLGIFVSPLFFLFTPASFWLLAEQTTTIWNGIAIVDGRPRDLLPSYLARRLPVAFLLLLALAFSLDATLSWSIGLGLGSVFAYVFEWRKQPRWARTLRARRPRARDGLEFDMAYWWSKVGAQIRTLDVAVASMLNPFAAGLYAFPAQFVGPMNMVTQAGSTVLFPKLIRTSHVAVKDFLVFLALGTMPVIMISGVIFVGAPLVPQWIGQEYADSVVPLQILCVAAIFTGAAGLVNAFLQARTTNGAVEFSGIATLVSGVAQVLLVAFGLVVYGANGAAVAALATQLVTFAVFLARGYLQAVHETNMVAE